VITGKDRSVPPILPGDGVVVPVLVGRGVGGVFVLVVWLAFCFWFG
jgi:hypothetical protein